MNDMVKYGLLAAGAFLIAKYTGVLDSIGITTVGAGQPVNTGGTTTSSPQGNDNANASSESATLKAMREFMAVRHMNMDTDMLSADLWNYMYGTVRGVTTAPAPEVLFPGDDRLRKYTIAEYWKALTGKGFNGLGMIAKVNPYRNPVQGMQFGDNLRPMGMELYIKKVG